MPKIAATIFFAFLLHVVWSNVGADYEGALVYWLLYTLACGVILNFDNLEKSWVIFVMSIPSPFVLLLVTFFRMYFKKGSGVCWLSGSECKADLEFFVMSGIILVGSVFFIWIFSYLSNMVIELTIKIFRLTDKKAKMLRKRVVWIGSFVIAVIGVVKILSHSWRLI